MMRMFVEVKIMGLKKAEAFAKVLENGILF